MLGAGGVHGVRREQQRRRSMVAGRREQQRLLQRQALTKQEPPRHWVLFVGSSLKGDKKSSGLRIYFCQNAINVVQRRGREAFCRHLRFALLCFAFVIYEEIAETFGIYSLPLRHRRTV